MFEKRKLKKEIKKETVNWDTVINFLKDGVSPKIGYPSKVLEKAILEQKEEVVDFLLKKYPDLIKECFIFDSCKSPLQTAFYSGSPKMVQRILEAGPNVRQMNSSTFCINWDCVNDTSFDLMMKGGFNVNGHDSHGYTYVENAIQKEDVRLLKKLIELGADYHTSRVSLTTPLTRACWSKQEEMALLLIQHNAQTRTVTNNDYYQDALLRSILNCWPIATQKLIERIPEQAISGAYGRDILQQVINKGTKESVTLCKALNINRNISGMPALIYAIQQDKAEAAEALFEMGANIHVKDANGNTALICAAQKGMMRLTKKLLQTDIALDIENQQGYTAYDIALESGHPAFAELIKNESLRRQGITQVSSQPTSAQIVQQKNLQQIRER